MPRNTTITAAVYLSILKEKLKLQMDIHQSTHFQQDGAPVHTAKIVKSWIAEENIELLSPWPGSSPDLNIIENCWTIMKKGVSKKSYKL